MSKALNIMIEQGVVGFGSYLDVDPAIEDKALIASQIVKKNYIDKIDVRFTTQTFKGLLNKEARDWFDKASEMVDIVGSTPRSDLGREAEHIEIVLKTAKRLGKMVHMHIDELHRESEKEMELLADKTIEYGMEGKVVAIHGISLSRQPKDYRQKIYKKIVDADITVVTCPTAWLDHPRTEELVPFHNSIFPVDEAVAAGVRVALGTDNFEDYTLPFGDGDMWFELRTLAHACRFTNIEELVKIATVNGRKALGII
jgi:cytosine/adenosine deaminase-related metal-dependent hydrolase